MACGAGKTQLMQVARGVPFDEASKSTIGVSFSVKEMSTHTGERVVVQVWDTAGQVRDAA